MNKIVIKKKYYDLVMKGNIIKEKNYTVSFIKLLLNNYYKELLQLLKSNKDLIITISDNNLNNNIKVDSIINIIDVMEELSNNNLLTKEESYKVIFLLTKFNYKRYFINDKEYFEYLYDGKKYKILASKLLNLFLTDIKNFKEIINNYTEIKKDELMVLLKKFALFLSTKKCNKNIKQNIDYILSITSEYEVVDEIKVKKKLKYLKDIHINNELIHDIIKDMPSNLSDIEKAIYIYIILCDILSHDVNDLYRNSYTINHKNINRLRYINKDNNIIVCYEFVAIFAKILDLFNIQYEIGGDKVYGRGHTYLKIIYKESIISFDSTRGLIDCDLTKTKNNIRVCNIVPVIGNSYVFTELNDAINNVYNIVEQQKNKKYYYETDYIKKYHINKQLDYNDRIRLFFQNIYYTKLQPVDNIKFILLLKKILFNNDELDISILECKYMSNRSILSMIFSFSINNNYEYYLYIYPNHFQKIDKKEIQNHFNSGFFNYIKFIDNKIPGIENNKKLEKV